MDIWKTFHSGSLYVFLHYQLSDVAEHSKMVNEFRVLLPNSLKEHPLKPDSWPILKTARYQVYSDTKQ